MAAMMTANLVAGIDVATAAVRVAVCDPDRTVVASAEQPLPAIRRPRPGWSEQAARASWRPARNDRGSSPRFSGPRWSARA
jgi:sugar (pentulose or hexulose) kinase